MKDAWVKTIKKNNPKGDQVAHKAYTGYRKILNRIMSNGTFPDVLKTGRITPVFKKGNPEEIENYRPISTLSIFGKIFEKIIYSRIYSFVSSQGIISKTQFGFRQSHSTSHAVNYSVNLITESLNLSIMS